MITHDSFATKSELINELIILLSGGRISNKFKRLENEIADGPNKKGGTNFLCSKTKRFDEILPHKLLLINYSPSYSSSVTNIASSN
jgi:hypothetical protein